MSGRADDLADRLDAIAEELSELALNELKAAIGERSSPEVVAAHRRTEKRLTQARRAVEKAAHVLRRTDSEADGDPDPG